MRSRAMRLPSHLVSPEEVAGFLKKHKITAYQLDLFCGNAGGRASGWIAGKSKPGRWLRPHLETLEFCLKNAPKEFFQGE